MPTVPGEDNETCNHFFEIDLKSPKIIDNINAFGRIDKGDYRKKNVDHSSELLNDNQPVKVTIENVQPNLIVITGEPGVGKILIVQNLAWQWGTGQDVLRNQYKLIFFMKVPNIKDGMVQSVLTVWP